MRFGNNKRSNPFIKVSHPKIVITTRQSNTQILCKNTMTTPTARVIIPQRNIVLLFFAPAKSLSRNFGFINRIRETTATRLWAFKNFAYSMVWSYEKSKGQWRFGFDPKIFSVEGFSPSSRATPKLVTRNPEKTYTKEELEAVKKREQGLAESLLKNPIYTSPKY